jgi:hypothetical protein
MTTRTKNRNKAATKIKRRLSAARLYWRLVRIGYSLYADDGFVKALLDWVLLMLS